ncbi:hypothetical protein Bca4012_097014 [Brassica carinata]|uniref:Uncharacterized protein n=2 Tax=Brassica TaxID=3705 RepID=A0A3P6GKU6_BRAOL|nr:unnamed protein product [Brassica napus]CDY22622.1 BnaC08g42560D [Brassica napus]VDD59234.1 unnamed protein product [Brassica oleracea]
MVHTEFTNALFRIIVSSLYLESRPSLYTYTEGKHNRWISIFHRFISKTLEAAFGVWRQKQAKHKSDEVFVSV